MFYKQIIQQRWSAVVILTTSMAIGVIYPLLGDKADDFVARINGFMIGLLGGLAIIFFELYLFFFPRRIYSFGLTLVAKVILYTVTFVFIILLTVSTTRSIENGISYFEYIQGPQFEHFLFREDFNVIVAYTMAAVVLVVSTRQISRKMGQGVWLNYLTGKYHKPRKEHRILLAIDLENSTAIAEKLGELKYHEFLKRFFYDITQSIAIRGGEIYRYVGDQVVVSWLLSSGLKDNNALQCFFDAEELLAKHSAFYQSAFGVLPRFRGVLDMGEVLTAEIGLDKQQLVFYGDVTERIGIIEKVCKREKQRFLLSEYIAIPLRQTRRFRFVPFIKIEETSLNPIQLFTASPC